MEDDNLIEEGRALYKRGNYSLALSYFSSLPGDSEAEEADLCYYLGLCYFRLERYEEALPYLEQVVTQYEGGDRENSRALQCRYILAIIYCLSDRKNLAAYELEELLQSAYKPASVYASLAYLAWDSGDMERSIDYYEKALAADDGNTTALNGLGYVLACKGQDLARALDCCKRAVDASPKSSACMDSLGWVYYKMGLYANAEEWLKKAAARSGAQPVSNEHESRSARESYDLILAHLDEVRQTESL